jgi:hypothetical protein
VKESNLDLDREIAKLQSNREVVALKFYSSAEELAVILFPDFEEARIVVVKVEFVQLGLHSAGSSVLPRFAL